ncbi:hypothetical protein BU24DRAFT_424942 [Aaosphaeria arxii CBS 175.79]|uniref:Cora-domain-containing protein n=1 Tax=Aaosphaeria arxii CBS 175.79 TaxID=1450172 RepID=A0A6A5XKX4_9PLEO|nr:uncharacterized protein BU24DRAFT_424942 [Aaosphaeria arxii CBS 175.79]KAF2013925.1 hypothetical protein BU24DRAFT_424942 [Aaosphaeria arxii CBS 175.79]
MAITVEVLQKQLETLQRSHDALLKSITDSNGSFGPSNDRLRRNTQDGHNGEGNPVFADNSTLSDDSSDEEDDYFVQSELPSQSYDHEHLREHLKKHDWDEHGREILAGVMSERGRLKQPNLFPTSRDPADDRGHYPHFQVYDVGPDGEAQLIESSGKDNKMSRANEIWHSIKDIAVNKAQSGKTVVGRITIAREPSPILFGALHLTMHNTFDMDELFRSLVQTDATSAHMHRAFHEERKRQKTFYFSFEYYTIIGEECKPMQWQRADRDIKHTESHIPLTRCGAVVALALFDDNPRRIRNRGRRAKTKYGWVQDVWSPWQVLNIQCYPDWRATADTFEQGHRYLNGAEAFLHALLTEYKDARKRYEVIYKGISELVTPALGFLFDTDLRDQRLFEDRKFTWTRRYFYAHQTLGNVNDSIKSMIDSFEDTFTDDVWEGKSKTLWPLYEESPRNDHWKRRLRLLRLQFEREMKELRTLQNENNDRRKEIESLQDHLFSGTSIQESRKSVELSDITVQQGRNIKLLTIVNLFFMPLTFVTSVYGMTNMPEYPASFWPFGLTLASVCLPFFGLVGFLSTDFGYRIWMAKTKAVWRWLRPKPDPTDEAEEFEPSPMNRTMSTREGMALRIGEEKRRRDTDAGLDRRPSHVSRPSHPHIKRMVEAMNEGKPAGVTRASTMPKWGSTVAADGDEKLDEDDDVKDTVINVKTV